MVEVAGHLGIEELGARHRAANDAVARAHFRMVWLLARGHDVARVAALVRFSRRWVQKILARYNAGGPAALGDRRRGHPGAEPLLDAEAEQALRERRAEPPEDGGPWTGPKVAAWMARRLGVERVHAPRGWEALRRLGNTLQVPRPAHARGAAPEEREAFKRSSPRRSRRRPRGIRTGAPRRGRSPSTASG